MENRADKRTTLTAISLFSSGGIGDLALRGLPVEVLVSNEILAERHGVFSVNFPEVSCITGDIRDKKNEIIEATRTRLAGRELDLLFATPPCQGMSKNGRGKLLNGIRSGQKPKLDERNRLIIAVLDLCDELNPETVVFENVPEMENTVIEEPAGTLVSIIDYVRERLGPAYRGRAEVVEFANYGVPQKRQRLITVFTRNSGLIRSLELRNTLMPRITHISGGGGGLPRWRTVRETIAHMPPLDARAKATASTDIPLHSVPLLDEDKYFWVSHTPAERGAFDNQCIECGFQGNPGHQAKRDEAGINRASDETPIHCVRCGGLLPRPWVRAADGRPRLMKGFTSAYKRMRWDAPANALTTNLAYACSDTKLHPEQHRVLSMLEATMIHTITDFDYRWMRADGRPANSQLIRDIIGESIPPRGLHIIFRHLVAHILGKMDEAEALQVNAEGNYELALSEAASREPLL